MQTVSPDHLIDKARPETNRVEMLAALADKPQIVLDVDDPIIVIDMEDGSVDEEEGLHLVGIIDRERVLLTGRPRHKRPCAPPRNARDRASSLDDIAVHRRRMAMTPRNTAASDAQDLPVGARGHVEEERAEPDVLVGYHSQSLIIGRQAELLGPHAKLSENGRVPGNQVPVAVVHVHRILPPTKQSRSMWRRTFTASSLPAARNSGAATERRYMVKITAVDGQP